ncbi:AEC family transporter [Candidatus Omnitrophota bacterium]
MITQFYDFYSIASGILKIFFLLSIGYLLYIRRLIEKKSADAISNILIWACVPALIFTKITSTFDPSEFPGWWFLPICSIGMSFIGACLGYLFQKGLKDFTSRREFISSCAFQNCGYLPMTLVAFACSGAFCDRILVYIFLFIIGFNITVWSFTPAFLSKNPKGGFRISAALNPPVIVTIFSILWVFLVGKDKVPGLIYDPLLTLGNASFPLALIALGAYLAEYRGYSSKNWKALISCLFVKLILLPAAVFILIRYLTLSESLKFFILLEATMPVAVSLIVIGQYVNADNKFLSGIIFYSHLFAIVTIPAWLLVFRNVLGS